MSKERKQKAEGQGRAAPPDAATGKPAVWVRWLLSALVIWHVFVVFISPFAVQPASKLVTDIATSVGVRWYTDSLYLNHGYHFFGPEPPINQVVRYSVTDEAGTVIAEGEFPNKEQQRPRLFYHRHMMLADQAAPGPPDIDPEQWLRLSLRAYGRHLLRVHEGDRVRVDCVRHVLLYPSQVLDGVDPNTPDKFVPVASIEEVAADLENPLPVPALPEPEPTYDTETLPAGGTL